MRLTPLPLVLAACVWSKDDFVADRNEALCALMVDCFDVYTDEAACQAAQRRDPERPCSGFDRGTARACVRLLRDQAASCPTNELSAWQIPATCADACVYPTWDTGS